MEKNNSDIFETRKMPIINDDNFFISANDSDKYKENVTNPDSYRRLNDYDFNLLKEDAYKDIGDDLFKLEYQISKTEKEIQKLEAEINSAQDIENLDYLLELKERKRVAIEDYEALTAMYNEKSLSCKITGIIKGKLDNGVNIFRDRFSDVSKNLLSNLPRPISKFFEIKRSLAKLERISRSVDELMNFNIPYGENVDKYNQLSKYIIKANSIQSQIAKRLKN